jgi:maleate isomerase
MNAVFPHAESLTDRNPRIGIIYPCSATRDRDFWLLAPSRASVHITRVPFTNQGTGEAVRAMSSVENLRAAANLIAAVAPHAIAWADTSGSFLFGPEGDKRQIELLSQATGVFSTTTSTALIAACSSLAINVVDIASPYLSELNDALVAFLEARGVRVGRLRALELEDAYAIASVPEEEQLRLVRSAAASGHAMLIPCTDFFSLSLINQIELELERPVLAANQVTMWHAVRGIGGYDGEMTLQFGQLFGT